MTETTNGEYHNDYDVVIVGGGSAGIGAAVGARQASPNTRILVIESESCLGGAATHRGVSCFCGILACDGTRRKCVGGVWDQVHRRLVDCGGTMKGPDEMLPRIWTFEPEDLKVVLDELLRDQRIGVLFHSAVVGAVREGGVIKTIYVQDRRGQRVIRGKAFVDCSGDGDLAYHGGASTRYGNHGNINLGTLAIQFGGLPKYLHPTRNQWHEAILEAKKKDPSLANIIRKDESVILTLPKSGNKVTYLPSATYDARDSSSISAAEQSGRKQAQLYLNILKQLPGHENLHLISTGPNFGTRESRHINSRLQLTKEHIQSQPSFGDDTVALGGWRMEWHDAKRDDWSVGWTNIPGGVFEIPLGCLHSVDTENLFMAGRCADADQDAGASIRVMGTALATGEAAGVAAAMFALEGRPPEGKHVREVVVRNGGLADIDRLTAV